MLVTGGTDGIGQAVASRLAARGATVAIVGRSAAKGQRLQRDLSATLHGTVDFFEADLALMTEVQRLAEAVSARYDRLDALVHSAGVVAHERVLTDEGLEKSFAINYLSRFWLTRLLTERLRASAPARVLNVAYAGGNSATALDFDNLQGEKHFGTMQALNQAQVANDLFGLELAERLEGTGVGVAVVNPGLVDTDIRRKGAPWYLRLLDTVLNPLARDPDDVATAITPLAADADVTAISGRFFGPDGAERPVPNDLQDPQLRRRLWRVSESLVQEATAEPQRVPA
jgi:NAD(P)-dependent dehydrogenase (short-subunit alcohol dehydrogenase family)